MIMGLHPLEFGYYLVLVAIFILTPFETRYLHGYKSTRSFRGPLIVDHSGLAVFGVLLSSLVVAVVFIVNMMPVGITVWGRIVLLAVCCIWPAILIVDAVQLGAHSLKSQPK